MDILKPPTGYAALNAVVSASSSGANEIVAAVSGKRISVVGWHVSPGGAVNMKWQSASTDVTGLYYASGAGDDKGASIGCAQWFSTAAGEALNLNLSGAVAVSGVVAYVLE